MYHHSLRIGPKIIIMQAASIKGLGYRYLHIHKGFFSETELAQQVYKAKTTSIQSRFRRWINVELMLFQRFVPAG